MLGRFFHCGALVLVILFTSVSAIGGEPLRWGTDLSQQLEAARADKGTVLVLMEVEADDALAETVCALAENTSHSAKRVRKIYPEVPYQDVAATQSFVDIADRAGVRHLPALVLLDALGRPSGAIEIDDLSDASELAQAIAQLFEDHAARDECFAAALETVGVERGSRLDAGLERVSASCRSAYHDVMQQIVDLDPDNVAGLKQKYEPVLVEVILNRAIQEQVYPLVDQAQYAAARQVLEWLAKEHAVNTEQRQLLLAFQAQLFYSEGLSTKAIDTLELAISMAPDSAAAERLKKAREQIVSPS